MWWWLYLKHRVVGTPLESLAARVRWTLAEGRRLRHPELAEVYYEPWLIERVLDRALAPDSCALDVGGHVGSLLHAIESRAPRGQHACFEPSPRKCAWLARRHPRARVHNVALGEHAGEVTFYENLSRPGFSALAPPAEGGERFRAYPVPLRRLDDLVAPELRIHFLKVDVEGAELGVLRGATRVLAESLPLVLFESGPGNAERCGFSRRGLWDFFAERDYRVLLLRSYLFDREPLSWEEFDRAHVYPFRAFNYVAVHPEGWLGHDVATRGFPGPV